MHPISSAKQLVLRSLERAGYVLLKNADYQRQQQAAEEHRTLLSALHVRNYELQQKLTKLEGEEGENATKITSAKDEIRRLQARVEGMPKIDYQVWMDHQAKSVTFKDSDPAFYALYERVKPYSMTSIERLYALHKATQYLIKSSIPGDIIECGVWRGGSMMMAALSALALGDSSRRLILFDTYEGLPKPNPDRDGRGIYDEWLRRSRTERSSDWAYASLEEVRQNIEATGYPMSRIALVKGLVQETIPNNIPDSIALLRLDTDWYESTAFELNQLYPRISDFGVLIIDDYGSLVGARKAVDEYFLDKGAGLLFNRIDHSGRLAIKLPFGLA